MNRITIRHHWRKLKHRYAQKPVIRIEGGIAYSYPVGTSFLCEPHADGILIRVAGNSDPGCQRAIGQAPDKRQMALFE